MAKAPRRPKNVSPDDWNRMNMKEKVYALHREGERAGYRGISRLVSRGEYAGATESRKGEAKIVRENSKSYAKKLQDPRFRAQLGGKQIIKDAKKGMSAGRMVKGKRVYMAGSEDAIKALRASIKEALDFDASEAKKLLRRAAKKLK